MSSFTFDERPNSRSGTTNPPSTTLEYVAAGSNSADFVRAYAIQATPPAVVVANTVCYRQDVQLTSAGHMLFYVSVPYTQRSEIEWTWRSSSLGGTFHIQASLETVARYAPPGKTARNHGGAINVQPDFTVGGADIVIPACKLVISCKHPTAVFTLAHAKMLTRLTGMVNSAPFLVWDAGEVLFLGHEGADGSKQEATVDYHFACEDNLQNVLIGGIEVAKKEGHDLLWSEFTKDVVGDRPVSKPIAIHIERVYRRIDLAAALGFGR